MVIDTIYDRFLQNPLISTDSRKIASGSIFFALHGDSFDGNNFAAQAIETGAVCAVVDNPRVAVDDRYILVDDTLDALQKLAAHHRHTLDIPVLAITGSNGKTTTKELVSRVLACKFNVAVTRGNLNNHIGVPLTLLSIEPSCEFAIVEMGASSCGEIELLCRLADPNYGIITNIGRAHLEGFGGPHGVRQGKGELFDYLDAHRGTAFYRSDDPVLCSMVDQRDGNCGHSANVISGLDGVRGFDVMRNGMTCVGYTASGDLPASQLVGDYNRYNVAAAVAIGRYFGVGIEQIAQAVASYQPDNNRSQRVSTTRNQLIVDCYNANPSSMNASLHNFAQEGDKTPDTQRAAKLAILGDMLELGEFSIEEHITVLRELETTGVSDVYVVGGNFCTAADFYTPQTYRLHMFLDRSALQNALNDSPISGKFILIKGSRGIGLETMIKCL